MDENETKKKILFTIFDDFGDRAEFFFSFALLFVLDKNIATDCIHKDF